jgi:DNA-directed RNA polymerase specialized sigma24 family protein
MPKISLHELALIARDGQVEQRKQYMVGVADAVYQCPRHYGFRNADEVGEAFCHYWTRIEAFPEHYSDAGTSFEAYLTSSLRYIALSIRRSLAKEFDKQAVCLDEQSRSISSGHTRVSWSQSEREDSWCRCEPSVYYRSQTKLPDERDERVIARAFRTRLIYLCIKCAYLLDEPKIIELSKLSGISPIVMMRWIHLARIYQPQRSIRTISRRRGRDSAWMRIGVNRRRLAREVDPDKRQMLKSRIDRDHGVYTRACMVIHNSRTMLPNKQVAEILGVSKSTVDSGLARILRKYLPLYADEEG